MDAGDERSQLFASLEESLCRDSDVEFVVAFGSRVVGDSDSSSDLDIAVKFADSLSSHERFQKRCFFSGSLQRADYPFIDISDIEELPLAAAHDAVEADLLCGDERAFSQFRADVEASFEERREKIHRHQQDVIDRIAEEGLRG